MDTIAISVDRVNRGDDVIGQIFRTPGGVAFNICRTLKILGSKTTIASVIGLDIQGQALIDILHEQNFNTDLLLRVDDPTCDYLAIEDKDGVVVAISDCSTIEKNTSRILSHVYRRLSALKDKIPNLMIVIDSNLSEEGYEQIADGKFFPDAQLILASASAAKVNRFASLASLPSTTIYLNIYEAQILCKHPKHFTSSEAAADAVISLGFKRAIVTDGGNAVADKYKNTLHIAYPPQTKPTMLTGAGDIFLAAHLHAQITGIDREFALDAALNALKCIQHAKT